MVSIPAAARAAVGVAAAVATIIGLQGVVNLVVPTFMPTSVVSQAVTWGTVDPRLDHRRRRGGDERASAELRARCRAIRRVPIMTKGTRRQAPRGARVRTGAFRDHGYEAEESLPTLGPGESNRRHDT